MTAQKGSLEGSRENTDSSLELVQRDEPRLDLRVEGGTVVQAADGGTVPALPNPDILSACSGADIHV